MVNTQNLYFLLGQVEHQLAAVEQQLSSVSKDMDKKDKMLRELSMQLRCKSKSYEMFKRVTRKIVTDDQWEKINADHLFFFDSECETTDDETEIEIIDN